MPTLNPPAPRLKEAGKGNGLGHHTEAMQGPGDSNLMRSTQSEHLVAWREVDAQVREVQRRHAGGGAKSMRRACERGERILELLDPGAVREDVATEDIGYGIELLRLEERSSKGILTAG